MISGVPYGTRVRGPALPGIETPGYSQTSLRDDSNATLFAPVW